MKTILRWNLTMQVNGLCVTNVKMMQVAAAMCALAIILISSRTAPALTY